MAKIVIRKATIEDIEALAEGHLQCWQEIYTTLLPAEILTRNARLGKKSSAFVPGRWELVKLILI
ncbi:hypothetical protein [Candidatus Paracaedibacter symbiosus]|uniref:hypothetical protein n=1 Tax=Candidatus Paracaedibacter symbiosus TaxID=244582 RepID=UPI000509AA3C|nr:hypothetical protein [Candidatus Paracaedibacter symbiosus]